MEETRCEKCKGAIEGPVLVRDDGHDLLFYHVACYYGGSVKSMDESIGKVRVWGDHLYSNLEGYLAW